MSTGKFLLFITIVFLLIVIKGQMIFYSGKEVEPDQNTKRLCREYANRDHEKELSPERWQSFLDRGIDLNRDFDWYGSCIKHNTNKVVRL